MKKSITTIITILALLSANAQIEKGTNAVGMNLDASYNVQLINNGNTTSLGLKIQPIFEHFISKNLGIGVALSYGVYQFDNNIKTPSITINTDYNIQNFGAQIQLKKYWFASNKIAFTLTPVVSSNYNETNSSTSLSDGSKSSNNSNYWLHSAYCNFGAVYFIKHNLAIEAQTTFFTYSFAPERNYYGNTHSINLSIIPSNLLLGVKFFFGKNPE